MCFACLNKTPLSSDMDNISCIEDTVTSLARTDTITECTDTVTVTMPVKAEDMNTKKPIKLSEITNEKAVAKQLVETVAPEKSEQAIKPAAGGEKGDTLQNKFNLLTNDKLDNLEKVTVIKDIQKQFVDKTTERVSGKFVGDAKPKYDIVAYLRRIKMTNSRKIHIKDIRTNNDGKIEQLVVEEIDEALLDKVK